MVETWCPIPGHEGYEVSTLGQVRSGSRVLTQFLRGKKPGYLSVYLGGGSQFVHRLVLLAFRGEPQEGEETRHLNGDQYDNRLENLAWGTRSENALDRVRHGTHFSSRKTHCPRGHLLGGHNLKPAGLREGKRKCLACDQANRYVKRHPEVSLKVEADRRYALIMA